MPHFIEQKKKDEIVSKFFERKKGSGISLLGFINIYSWRHRPRFGGTALVLEAQALRVNGRPRLCKLRTC